VPKPGKRDRRQTRPRRFGHPPLDQPARYVIFYKPHDVLSQFTDSQGDRANLKDFIPIPDIYPVGRLDRDSEGLLLLTNHGQLQHRLSSPHYGHPRTYWVQVERLPDDTAIAQLSQGVIIQGQRTRPAQVTRLVGEPELPPRVPPIRYRKSVPTCWLELVLTEAQSPGAAHDGGGGPSHPAAGALGDRRPHAGGSQSRGVAIALPPTEGHQLLVENGLSASS